MPTYDNRLGQKQCRKSIVTRSSFFGRTAALATKHEKERAVARPLYAALGVTVIVPDGIDTDTLGTFTGEVKRRGSPREVALEKARLGLRPGEMSIGIASEGGLVHTRSFHSCPWRTSCSSSSTASGASRLRKTSSPKTQISTIVR